MKTPTMLFMSSNWIQSVPTTAIVVTLLALLVVQSLGRIVLHLTDRALRRQPHYPADTSLSASCGAPLATFLTLCVMALRWRDLGLESVFPETAFVALQLSIVGVFAWLLISGINFVFRWLNSAFDVSQADNLRSRRVRTQLGFLHKLVTFLVVVLGVALALMSFEAGRQLGTSLLASAGVASLVIGLAAQRSLASFIAGFQIAFTQPIRLEDAIVVENEWGWVEEINLTYVVVRLWDRRRLILPINYFLEKPFQNWTRNSAQILGAVHLRVSFAIPFEKLEREFNRLLDATEMWDRDARVMQVVEAHEHNVELRMLMTARDSPTAFDLRCYVRRHMLEFIENEHPKSLPAVRLDTQTRAASPLRFEAAETANAS